MLEAAGGVCLSEMPWHRRAGGQLPQVSTDEPWQGQPGRSGWDVECSRRRRRLSCLGKVTQRAKDWWGESETLSCLWALNMAQPPLPLHFPACCSSGAAEGAARSAVPARAQSSSPSCPGQPLPSRACGCSLLAPRFVVPKRANTAGRGGSPGGNESSPGPAAGKSLRGCFCRVRCWGFSLGSHNALRSRML